MNQRRKKLKFPKFRVKSAKCGGSNNPGGGTNPVDSNPQVPGGICLTVGGGKVGAKCAFPFTYEGTTYRGCTRKNDPKGRLWCSTRTDSKGFHLLKQNQWGYCNSECPEHLSKMNLSSFNNLNHALQTTSRSQSILRPQVKLK